MTGMASACSLTYDHQGLSHSEAVLSARKERRKGFAALGISVLDSTENQELHGKACLRVLKSHRHMQDLCVFGHQSKCQLYRTSRISSSEATA